MLKQYHKVENIRSNELPNDIQNLVNTLVSGIMALATRVANSNSDSNSLGGILIHSTVTAKEDEAMAYWSPSL